MVELPKIRIDSIQPIIDLVKPTINFIESREHIGTQLFNIVAIEQYPSKDGDQRNSNNHDVVHICHLIPFL